MKIKKITIKYIPKFLSYLHIAHVEVNGVNYRMFAYFDNIDFNKLEDFIKEEISKHKGEE